MLFIAHAESPWMPRLRRIARGVAWVALGLCAGAVVDLCVRLAVPG
jgi:hypothetical protein